MSSGLRNNTVSTKSDWWVWILEFILPSRFWYRNYYLRSEHWKHIRRQRLEGVRYCQRCFRTKMRCGGFDVHHLTYQNMWHEHMNDLQVICRDCHKKEHSR